MNIVAERIFIESDQARFAALSGDWNPMHMDPVLARRTQAGAPVVHGVHLLLWALDAFLANRPARGPICRVRAEFSHFVHLDVPATIVVEPEQVETAQAVTIELRITACGLDTTIITVEFGDTDDDAPIAADQSDVRPGGSLADAPELTALAGRSGWMPPEAPTTLFAAAFPALCAVIGSERTTAIALTTRLVGMLAPGLHSIFGSLDLRFTAPHPRAGLGFRVAAANPRTRVVRSEVGGSGVLGSVVSFARWPAVAQPSIADLAGLVGRDEFAGSHVLITGGSRGLGALTTKIIAAGGGKTIVTYAVGREDAAQLTDEINAFTGKADCAAMRYDFTSPVTGQFHDLPRGITHFYHFASPRIFRQKGTLFDPVLLAEFNQAYVTAFHDLCLMLQAREPHRIGAFYPSSVALGPERPAGMTEYAMAKAAGEILAEDMSRTRGLPLVLSRRLPRMLTDQTATLARVASAEPLAVMLPIIRAVQPRAAAAA